MIKFLKNYNEKVFFVQSPFVVLLKSIFIRNKVEIYLSYLPKFFPFIIICISWDRGLLKPNLYYNIKKPIDRSVSAVKTKYEILLNY